MTVGGCAGVPALHRSCQALSARLSASKAFPPGTVCVQDATQTSAAERGAQCARSVPYSTATATPC